MLPPRLRSFSTRAALTMIAAGFVVALPLAYSSVAQAQTNCAPAAPAAPPTLAAPSTTAVAAPTTPTVAAPTAAATPAASASTVAKPAPTIEGIVVLEAGVSFDVPTTVADTVAPTTVADTVAPIVAPAAILARTPSILVQARRLSYQAQPCVGSGQVAGAEAADAGEGTSLAFTGARHNDRKVVGGASLLVAGAVLLVGTRSQQRRGERDQDR